MNETPEEIQIKLDEIERNYNMFLELLQNIVDEKGDAASQDPEYISLYNDASKLNEQYEELQDKLFDMEKELASKSPAPKPTAPVKAPKPTAPVKAPKPTEQPSTMIQATKPSPPKYISVEKTRVEQKIIHEHSWEFVGVTSNVNSSITDLSKKGGYVTGNILNKEYGKATFINSMKANFPMGLMFSQFVKRFKTTPAGLIYYPNESLTQENIKNTLQIIQQFLAGDVPNNHKIVFLKLNEVKSDEQRVSIIMGGLEEKDASLKNKLIKNLGNVHFDNGIFYKGELLNILKDYCNKTRIQLVTVICTSNIFQNHDYFQRFIKSF